MTVKDAINKLFNYYKQTDLELNELYNLVQDYIKEFKLENTLVECIILESFLEYEKYKGIKNENN